MTCWVAWSTHARYARNTEYVTQVFHYLPHVPTFATALLFEKSTEFDVQVTVHRDNSYNKTN